MSLHSIIYLCSFATNLLIILFRLMHESAAYSVLTLYKFYCSFFFHFRASLLYTRKVRPTIFDFIFIKIRKYFCWGIGSFSLWRALVTSLKIVLNLYWTFCFTVKENHISPNVSRTLRYTQTSKFLLYYKDLIVISFIVL